VALNAAIAPNGRWEAISIGGDASASRQLTVSLSNADPLNLSCMLKCSVASTIYVVALEGDGSTPASDPIEFAVTTKWKRFDALNIPLYGGSVPEMIAWYAPGSGETLYLGGPVWVDQDTINHAPPVGIPVTAGGDPASYITAEALSLDPHYHYEGEIVAEVVTYNQSVEPGTFGRLVSNADDHHKLYAASGEVRFSHRDGSGAEVISEVADIEDWTTTQTVRGRWNRLGLLDAASAFAGVVTGSGQDFDRAATWTPDSAGYDAVQIGHDNGASQLNGLVVRVTVRAREAILPDVL
jgi:hypothetical protein